MYDYAVVHVPVKSWVLLVFRGSSRQNCLGSDTICKLGGSPNHPQIWYTARKTYWKLLSSQWWFPTGKGYRLNQAREGAFRVQEMCQPRSRHCLLPHGVQTLMWDNTEHCQPRKLTPASLLRVLIRVPLYLHHWLIDWLPIGLNSVSRSTDTTRPKTPTLNHNVTIWLAWGTSQRKPRSQEQKVRPLFEQD